VAMSAPPTNTIVPRPEQANALQRLKIWAKLAKGELHTITKKDVEDLYAVLDTEEKGDINRDDLLVLRQIPGLCLTSEDVDNLINDADKDNSGKVNQDELFKALTQGELAYSVVLAALGQKKAALKTTECDKEDLIEFLRYEYETKSSLWSLPQTLMFFLCFFISMTAHMDITTAYSMQNALRGEIEGEGTPYLRKYVHDVPTFWDWMESSFLTGIFKSGDGELDIWPYPGRIASYNQIIGGVQLTRINSSPDVCLQSSTLQSFYDSRHGGRCHKQESTTKTSAVLHYHERREEIGAQLAELRKSSLSNISWVDQNTTSVSANMLLYNAHLEAFTVLHLWFNFKSDGEVQILFDMETFLSDPYRNILWIIPDIIFGLILLRMFYSEMLELVPALMNGIDGFQQYMQFWNVVDWFAIIFGVAVMTMWALIVAMVSGDLQEKISSLNVAVLDDVVLTNRTYLTAQQFSEVMPAEAFDANIMDLHTQMEEVAALHRWVRVIAFAYNFVLMLKFFKAFQANPRLNIVIKTIQTSAIDIVHFLIVFLTIFFVFSSAAYVFFGGRMKEFSTQIKALIYCWRILMGEFDVEAMELVSPLAADLWLLVFQFLVLQVLLNMLLAIIMDTYSAVNEPGAETIWWQIRQALHTARETRGHLDMWYLICEFEDEDYQVTPDRVTSKSLRSAFESKRMTRHNADYLIRKTAEFVKAKESKSELKMSDAVRLISRMQTTGLRVQEAVDNILDMMKEERRRPQEERFDAIMAGQDPDDPKRARNGKANSPGNGAVVPTPKSGALSNRPMHSNGFGSPNPMQTPSSNQVLALPFSGDRRPSVQPSLDGSSRRPSNTSLSNFQTPSRPQVPTNLPGAMMGDDQIASSLEQLQTTVDGVLSEQFRVEQALVEEIRDLRVYIEQRDAWLEQRLNSMDRRFEKVERAADRMTTSMQGFDFRELMGATDRVAHYLQLQQSRGAAPSSGMRRRNSTESDALSPGLRKSLFSEEASPVPPTPPDQVPEYNDMDGYLGQMGEEQLQDQLALPLDSVESNMSPAARKQMAHQLDRIGEQVQQLLAHAEESAETRRLLWKIDLNIRQTRTSVQKIEEHGLRPASGPPSRGHLSDGFARQASLRSGASRSPAGAAVQPMATMSEVVSMPSVMERGPSLGRLPAVPDHGERESSVGNESEGHSIMRLPSVPDHGDEASGGRRAGGLQ